MYEYTISGRNNGSISNNLLSSFFEFLHSFWSRVEKLLKKLKTVKFTKIEVEIE